MKELSIEQKATAYEDLLKKAKQYYDTENDVIVLHFLEELFPELCESEDEKVREDIISLVNEFWERIGSINPEYSSRSRMLAWLEKQGTSYTKKDVDDAYVEGIAFAKNELEKQGEQKPIDKIQLGKKYKCIASPRYSTFRRGNIYKPVDNFLCNLMNLCYECFEPIEDSEQKPTDDEMKEALRTEYGKGRADAFAEMQKEWSEEDENGLGDAIWCCKQAASIAKDENDMGNVWYAEHWLKSLKERYFWKPSDKQMKQLGWVAEQNKDNMIGKELMSLYQDLKKLKT